MTEAHAQSERDHAEAMGHANEGFAHRDRGEQDDAVAAFRRAWKLERRAAMSLIDQELEPSRSILFRSAASLASLCGEHDDARKLAHLGLGGSPSRRVRDALEALVIGSTSFRLEAARASSPRPSPRSTRSLRESPR